MQHREAHPPSPYRPVGSWRANESGQSQTSAVGICAHIADKYPIQPGADDVQWARMIVEQDLKIRALRLQVAELSALSDFHEARLAFMDCCSMTRNSNGSYVCMYGDIVQEARSLNEALFRVLRVVTGKKDPQADDIMGEVEYFWTQDSADHDPE